MTILKLSEVQRQAVEYYDGPLRIIAGAGSGKTASLISKFIYLTDDIKLESDRILAITFTNRAANEMKERLVKMTNSSIGKFPWVRTFHSACLQVIKSEVELLGFKVPITLYDVSDQISTLKEVLKEMSISGDQLKEQRTIISTYKQSVNVEINTFFKTYIGRVSKPEEVYLKYNQKLKESNALDFDDILFYMLKLLVKYPEFKSRWSSYFQYILVDEFQDTNELQYEIMKHLETSGNFSVVGDDFQSVYSFRGAKPNLFINTIVKDYPNLKTIKLEQNYRSTKQIVSLGNSIVLANKNQVKKECFSIIEGKDINLVSFPDPEVETTAMVSAINKYIKDNISADNIAIIYRARSISRYYESALRKAKIPYEVISGLEFFNRWEIKDLISFIKFIHNPRDVQAFKRIINIPKRGIGIKKIEQILESNGDTCIDRCRYVVNSTTSKVNNDLQTFINLYVELKKYTNPKDILEIIINRINYKTYATTIISKDKEEANDRLENINELLTFANDFEDIDQFLEYCVLVNDTDSDNNGQEVSKVKLMTIHASKGTEFDVVFLVGCEQGIIPHVMNNDIEEERRLMYVACTRSKGILNLTYCRFRPSYQGSYPKPSDFLDLIRDKCKFIEVSNKIK